MPSSPRPEALTSVRDGLAVFHPPGSGHVFEVRIPVDRGTTHAGYFDDLDVAADAIERATSYGRSIYVTLNPVEPVLIKRAPNRLVERARALTVDAQVVRRRRLLLDFDPVRPARTAATDAELHAALDRRHHVVEWLARECGWPEPVLIMSGNGGHAIYGLDLEATPATRDLVKAVLDALHHGFGDDAVEVDRTVANASRITKIPGTYSRKGTSTPERPHRRAEIERVPAGLVVLTVDQLRAVVDLVPGARRQLTARTVRQSTVEPARAPEPSFEAATTPVECFERIFAALDRTGCRPQRTSAGKLRAVCPAHRDVRPSLGVTQTESGALITCFAGCARRDVLARLGLTFGDVHAGPRSAGRSAHFVESVYAYEDWDGIPIAEKVRFRPKAFKWRKPNSRTFGIHGTALPLFRLPDLIDARRVVVNEGEKAALRLSALGIAATSPPIGATAWRDEWSEQLWSAGAVEVIVIADRDQPGDRHAERVAARLSGFRCFPRLPATAVEPWASWPSADDDAPELAPLRVKVVRLPGLLPGGDVVDYLDAGHTRVELVDLIDRTPYWTPDLRDQQRRERSRALTRERVRRHRERRRRVTRHAPSPETVRAAPAQLPCAL